MHMMCAKLLAMTAGAVGLSILWLPLGLQAQLVLSLAALAVMFVGMSRPDNSKFRIVTFIFCGILAMRYAFWRTTETLPNFSEPINFIPGLLLYIAEMYCLIMLGVSFFMLSDPIKRRAPKVKSIDELPSVDVFIPTYNEEPELLAATMAAAKSMVYPQDRLKIYLLDDGGTEAKRFHKDPKVSVSATKRHEELKLLCEAMGVIYHTRKRNDHAKAGNLNAGMEVSDGDLIVVFDADHAPVRTFLKETVSFFNEDEKLFLVQTPHYFLNPDPLERNFETFARMPSENEMFYSVVQRGLDKWNSSFFCGSGAILRRSALNTVNGFSGQSITEDCETALSLHSQGWHSVYVDKPLIAGLQPETFVSFIGQRARWCQGMLQILILNRPFLAKGLNMTQRVCYAGINLFWLFPLSRLAFMFAPLLYIFLSLEIYQANIYEFATYALTYLIASFAMQSYLFGRVRWPWISELYEYVQSVMLFGSIVSVVRKPRAPSFNVTAKGETLEQNARSPLARPYYIIFFLLLAASLYAGYRLLTEPVASDLLLIVALWNTINLGLAGAALGVVSERRELRRNHRIPVARHGLLRIAGNTHSVLIKDASTGGVSIEFSDNEPDFSGEEPLVGEVEIRRGGRQVRFSVVHRGERQGPNGTFHGFAYPERTPATFMAIAELMYSDQNVLQERQDRRQVRLGFFRGTFQFTTWVVRETVRGLMYLVGAIHNEPVTSHPDAPVQIKSNRAKITSTGEDVPKIVAKVKANA